jgi:hypothetical protein
VNDFPELDAGQRRSIREAPLVVIGAVEQRGETAEPGRVALRVEETLRAPTAFAGLAGQHLEVRTQESQPEMSGRVVLLADGLSYGETMIVRELGRLPVEAVEGVRSAVDQAEREAPMERVRERAAGADVVVVAEVEQLRRHDPEQRRERPPSEHDPDWWVAPLSVVDVLAGRPRLRKGTLELAFPNSRDVMWASAPKPEAGQVAVWLLRRGQVKGLPRAFYTALDPDDVRPPEERELVAEFATEKQ